MESYGRFQGISLSLPGGGVHRIRVIQDTSPIKACINFVPITGRGDDLIGCIADAMYPERQVRGGNWFIFAGTDRSRTSGMCFNPDLYAEIRATAKPYGYLLEVDASSNGTYEMKADVIINGRSYPAVIEAGAIDDPVAKEKLQNIQT